MQVCLDCMKICSQGTLGIPTDSLGIPTDSPVIPTDSLEDPRTRAWSLSTACLKYREVRTLQ